MKLRSTWSGAWRPPSLAVVVTNLRRLTPATPACVISRATRLRPTRMPLAAELGMDARRTVGPARGRMPARIAAISAASVSAPLRRPPLLPPMTATGQETPSSPAHRDDRVVCLVIAHEPEPFAGIAFVSRANQAAAFERISRSSRSWRFSRHSRLSSSRYESATNCLRRCRRTRRRRRHRLGDKSPSRSPRSCSRWGCRSVPGPPLDIACIPLTSRRSAIAARNACERVNPDLEVEEGDCQVNQGWRQDDRRARLPA